MLLGACTPILPMTKRMTHLIPFFQKIGGASWNRFSPCTLKVVTMSCQLPYFMSAAVVDWAAFSWLRPKPMPGRESSTR